MKPLIIFHSPCVDGFGAALVAWLAFGGKADFYPTGYTQNPPDVSGRVVYILDFSYEPEVLRALIRDAKKIVILDHHKTAKRKLLPMLESGEVYGEFDMDRSGAMMAWDHFFPDECAPELIKYIQDRDLFRFEFPDTNEVSHALRSYPVSFDLWYQFMTEDGIELLREEGVPIWRYHQKITKEIAAGATVRDMVGYQVPVANAPGIYADDVGYMLAPGNEFSASYFDSPLGRFFSLRSTKDGIDVSELAERFGGGGHARSAGFRIHMSRDLLTA